MTGHLPKIIIENGRLSFICPACNGLGNVRNIRNENTAMGTASSETTEACKHCNGFGRLPVPEWYRKQEERP